MDDVAIIMPAYNEEKRIGKTLDEYSGFFNKLKSEGIINYEILVVINNTTDNTLGIVKKAMGNNKNIKYMNLVQGGKGYAVIEGFKECLKRDFNLIGFVDSDCATSPEEYFKVILAAKKSDGAIADRYLKDSKIYPKPSIKRLMARKAFNFLIRGMLLIPFGDTQCGAKVFKRNVLGRVLPNLSMSQWAFDVELLYHLHKKGAIIKAIPTKWSDKEYSKINFWKAGPWMALGVIRLRLLNSRARKLVSVYDKLIGFIPK